MRSFNEFLEDKKLEAFHQDGPLSGFENDVRHYSELLRQRGTDVNISVTESPTGSDQLILISGLASNDDTVLQKIVKNLRTVAEKWGFDYVNDRRVHGGHQIVFRHFEGNSVHRIGQ